MYTLAANAVFVRDGYTFTGEHVKTEGYFQYLAARLEIIRNATLISEEHKHRLLEKYCRELRYLDEHYKIVDR